MASNVREIHPLKPAEGRFFKVQIKGWIDFDPTGRQFSDIAWAFENGSGFVSVVEVAQVANNVGDIADPEVRERFADVLAANRVLQHVAGLPSSLKDRLQRALANEGADGPAGTERTS